MAQALAVLKRIIKQDFLTEFLQEVQVKLPTFGPVALSHFIVALSTICEKGRKGSRQGRDE